MGDTPSSANYTAFRFHQRYGSKLSPFNDSSHQEFEENWCKPTWLKIPGRAISYHLGSLIPGVLFLSFMTLLLIYYRHDEPLKSRGDLPLLGMFVFILLIVLEYLIAYLTTYEKTYIFECHVTALMIYPFMPGLFMSTFLQFIRFISIVNINVAKEKAGTAMKRMSLFYKFLNRVSRKEYMIIPPILFYLFYLILYLIVNSFYSFRCGTFAILVMRYGLIGFTGVCFLLLVCCQVYDLISNWRLITRCKLKDFYIKQDHYFYRLELSFVPIPTILLVTWILTIPSTIQMFFFDAIYGSLLFMPCGWLILGITIYRRHFKKGKKRITSSQIENIFLSEELLKLFLEFAKHDWSAENVLFVIQALKFEHARSEKREQLLEEIHKNFLSFGDSPYEINVPSTVINQYQYILEDCKNSGKEYPHDLLVALKKEVLVNLKDVFSRFSATEEFRTWETKKALLSENEK